LSLKGQQFITYRLQADTFYSISTRYTSRQSRK